MKTTNLDLEVKEYFNETGQILPEVFDLEPGVIKELIDAIPDDGNPELIDALKEVLQWEGE